MGPLKDALGNALPVFKASSPGHDSYFEHALSQYETRANLYVPMEQDRHWQ